MKLYYFKIFFISILHLSSTGKKFVKFIFTKLFTIIRYIIIVPCVNNSPVINQGIEPGPNAKNITNANVEMIANMPFPSVETSESPSLLQFLVSVLLQFGSTSFFSGFEIFKDMVINMEHTIIPIIPI